MLTAITKGVRNGMMDRLAIGLSGLCLVHCLASALMVTMAASIAGAFLNPLIHEIGLVLALILGLGTLGQGFVAHGRWLPALVGGVGLVMMAGALVIGHDADAYAVAGVLVLAAGHVLNRRAFA